MTEQTAQNSARRDRRSRTGTVSSVSGDKTVSVIVENLVKHPKYGKYIRRRSKLAVHDPKGQAKAGDFVEIVPCRRISKSKSWRLVRVVRRPAITAAEMRDGR